MSTRVNGCICSEMVIQKVKNHLLSKDDNPRGYQIENISWQHESYYPVRKLYSEVMVTSTFQKKDGSQSQPKTKAVSIMHTYCPFCGLKFENTIESGDKQS